MPRIASLKRETKETQIEITLNLDGNGKSSIESPVNFLNHMLDQLARHGLFDITIKAKGDVEIDDHHLVEDIGIVLGDCFEKALGEKIGITRFGFFYAPLDEALSRVVVDLSSRPHLDYCVSYTKDTVGQFDLSLLNEFFQAFVNHSKMTLHIDNLKGNNSHHQAESVFKAFARALKMAVSFDKSFAGILPSTKEKL